MSEFASENSEMSSVSEASTLVRRIAGPRDAGESIKAKIAQAARRLGFSYSRTKDLWYSDARRIDAAEMDRLRARAARLDREQAIATMVGLRDRLAKTDSDFHGETIAALDHSLRALGAEIRPVGFRENREG